LVPKATLRWTHTFGLGGSSLVLILLLMMFHYEPSSLQAYDSVVRLRLDVPFGLLVRNVHHWSANLLVVVALLHLLRVFFTGGFLGPRQFNWIVGLGLMLAILVANFTGYLLPWDQLAYWAITISTGMLGYVPALGGWLQQLARGGGEISSATLVIFYSLHTTVVPVALVLLSGFHFWRVRRAAGVVVPRAIGDPEEAQPEKVLLLPHLLIREAAQAAVLVAAVVVVSVLFDAPLGQAANPGMSPNPAKSPWYFAGFQELLLHLHPMVAVVVLPIAGAALLAVIPYLGSAAAPPGVWFRSVVGRRTAALGALTALVATPAWVLADEYLLDLRGWLPGVPPLVRDGLLPLAALAAGLALFVSVVRRRMHAAPDEVVQSVVVLAAVAFAVLTVTCVWFRGPGMALVWPWSSG